LRLPVTHVTLRYPAGVKRAAAILTTAALLACSHKPGPTKKAFLTPEPSASITLGFDLQTKAIHLHFQGTGLLRTTAYTLQIRRGTCLRPSGLLASSTAVTSDAAGSVDATVKADRPFPSGIPKGIHVDLRIGTPDTAQGVSSACTDVPARAPTKALSFFRPPTLRAGGSFTATFKDARTLSLQLKLVGVMPGEHDVGIYAGSCTSQGRIDTGLGDLTADAAGSASLTKVIHVKSKSGTLYIGVSSGPARLVGAASPIESQLILCGDLPGRPA
jgi:hypothetical protein